MCQADMGVFLSDTDMSPRLCACWGVPSNLVPALLNDQKWKSVSTLYGKWRVCLQQYVEAKQDSGFFGNIASSSSSQTQPLDEFEVDETCVRKHDLPDDTVEWNEYVGLKRRGDPESLYLEQRDVEKSRSKRSRTCHHRRTPSRSGCNWHVKKSGLELCNTAMVPKRTNRIWTELNVTMSVTAIEEMGLKLSRVVQHLRLPLLELKVSTAGGDMQRRTSLA